MLHSNNQMKQYREPNKSTCFVTDEPTLKNNVKITFPATSENLLPV